MGEVFNMDVVRRIILVVPALLIAASFHEFAHGWVADRLGDPTARHMGRLNLNPIRHIDPFGSILLPLLLVLSQSGFLFGWAKPVPVNSFNLNHPKSGMAWVAAAGPISNFSLAFSGALFLKLLLPLVIHVKFIAEPVMGFFTYFIYINLLLGIFNLMPVPPLDGGRIAVGLLPDNIAERWAAIEPYGMWIILILFMFDPIGIWPKVLGPVIHTLANLLISFAGLHG